MEAVMQRTHCFNWRPLANATGFAATLAVLSACGPVSITNPAVTYEAEIATASGATVVESSASGFTGAGYVRFTGEGALGWSVEVVERGLYQLEVRFARASGDVPLNITAGGIPVRDAVGSGVSNIAFEATGSDANYKVKTFFAKLQPGANTIQVQTAGSGGPNIDHMLVSLTPPDANKFLTFPISTSHTVFEGSQAQADSYYQTIDPTSQRTSFSAWKRYVGFEFLNNGSPQHIDCVQPTSTCASAIYFNNVDLALGRRMYVRPANGGVASYVANYPTLEDAIAGTNLVAAVAMEFVRPANNPTGPKITTFYVFQDKNKDGELERVTSIDLDGRGEKFVPGLCNVCHGGKPKDGGLHGTTLTDYQDGGDTGAKWIPWDLDTYLFSPSLPRAAQEARFRKLNEFILAINAESPANATPTAAELIKGWYHAPAIGSGVPLPANNFDGTFVPSGWSSKPVLYSKVVAPACRTCHNQRGSYNNSPIGVITLGTPLDWSLEFSTFAHFNAYKDQIESLVYDTGLMPAAKRTYENFWRSTQPKILDDELFAGTAYQNPPCSGGSWPECKLAGYAKFDFGPGRRPGRPLPNVAGIRFDPSLTPVLAKFPIGASIPLNASSSPFAASHFWSFLQYPGSTPPAFNPSNNVAKTSFTSAADTYQVRLSVTNEFASYNEIIRPLMFLRPPTQLKKVVFDDPASNNDIYGTLTAVQQSSTGSNLSCVNCHNRSGIPGDARGIFEMRDVNAGPPEYQPFLAFARMLTRIDCKNPQDSLILKKPASAGEHAGGAINGFSEASGINAIASGDENTRAAILRWIIAGAPYDNSATTTRGCP
jgi:hypothetical protein